MPEAPSSRKPLGVGAGRTPRETVERRLREAGLDVKLGVDLTDGTKESYTNHRELRNQYEPTALEGNYGVLARDRFVAVDVDTYRDGVDGVPAAVEALPDTFTVLSPHGGEHRYYAVEGDVGNSVLEWGEVRAKNQYVVGPGSELTDCDHGCCTPESPGRYEVLHDRPIATISAQELPGTDTSAVGQDTADLPDPGEDFTDIEAPFDVQQRFEKATNCAYGEKLTALWEGRGHEVGYGHDRSAAETALASYLAWWMDNDRRVVAALMNESNARKWAERGDTYRQSVLDNACDHSRTFEAAEGWPTTFGKSRREVSGPTQERVLDALLELGTARTVELVEHERVDRGERQVRRALDHLTEDGLVDSVRDGRKVLHYHTVYESTLPELLR